MNNLPETKTQRFLENNNLFALTSIPNLIEAFIIDILNIDINLDEFEGTPINRVHTWEAIGGPNRMCAFDPSPHTELACSYVEDQCGISYLGYSKTSVEGNMEWIPHFEIIHSFPEPIYWILNTISDCNRALHDLGNVFIGNSNWNDFYSLYPPSNRNLSNTFNPDPEGFVTYFLMENFNEQLNYVYCKTKTWMYYIMHKVRGSDIPTILRMPEQFGQAFPSYYKVQSFFSDGAVNNLINLLTELCEFVLSDEMKADLPEKALSGLTRINQPSVAFKLILNNSKKVWKYGSVKIAEKYYSCFAIENEGVNEPFYHEHFEESSLMLRALLMELKCYDNDWEENVKNELNYENIAKKKQFCPSIGRLWNIVNEK